MKTIISTISNFLKRVIPESKFTEYETEGEKMVAIWKQWGHKIYDSHFYKIKV
jgi:hypothetical protein